MNPVRFLLSASIAFAVATLSLQQAQADEKKVEKKAETKVEKKEKKVEKKAEAKVKTIAAEFEGLTLNVPKTWKQQKPSNRLRLGQFAIPASADKGEEDIELTIFNFGGGGQVGANIKRWTDQFQSNDREVKITKGAIKDIPYVVLEVTGTYRKSIGPPIQRKTKDVPGSRMIAVILPTKDSGVFYLKMTGAQKSVAAEAKSLRSSFGGDAASEKPLELK